MSSGGASMSSGSEKHVNKKHAGPTFDVTILRSKSTGQMIYLEAKKDLVDVLLSFLVLPVGTIMRVLNAQGLVNSTSFNLRRLSLVVFPWSLLIDVEIFCELN
jgi:hypothetical protein